MVLENRSKNAKYSEKQRNLAQSIEFRSHKAYEFLRDSLKLQLPSTRSLNNWHILDQLQPGFNLALLNRIALKIQNFSERSQQHILLFDEIKIRPDLKFNGVTDEIVGLVDLGEDNRHPIPAKYICLFMARGIFSSDKFVISYFTTQSPIAGQTLKELIIKNIEVVQKLGIKLWGVSCDQGANNRNAYEQLGVTKDKPYFLFENRKIFAFYDIPHLFKSVRNTLLRYDFQTSNGLVSWDVLVEMFQQDSQSVTRVCPKLTSKHIYPTTFDKMRVSLATQILSHSCANGIRTFNHLKRFKNKKVIENASATASFLENMNQLFDSLNSRCRFSPNSANSGLSLDPNNVPFTILKEASEFLKQVKVQTVNKIFCIDGLLQTILGITQMMEELCNANLGVSYILTSKLQTDAVENLFSQVRSRGGNNFNPSVYEFNYIIAKIMSNKIIFHTSCVNYEPDNCSFMLETGMVKSISTDQQTSSKSPEINNNQHFGELNNDDEDYSDSYLNEIVFVDSFINQNLQIDLPSLRYFPGYVIFKLLKKSLCESCKELMTKQNETLSLPSEYLIKCKNYLNPSEELYLRNPNDFFFELAYMHVEIFAKHFVSKMHKKKILQFLYDKCVNATNSNGKYCNWFTGSCKAHKESALKFLLLLLIRKNCMWQLQKFKNDSNKIKSVASNTSRDSSRKLKIMCS